MLKASIQGGVLKGGGEKKKKKKGGGGGGGGGGARLRDPQNLTNDERGNVEGKARWPARPMHV